MRKTLSITTAFILLTLILTQWAVAQTFAAPGLIWKDNTVTNALPVTIYVTFATWKPAGDIQAEGDRAAGYYPIPPGSSHTFRAANNESIFFRFQRLDGLRGYAPVMYLSPTTDTPTVSSWVPYEFEDIPRLEWVDDDFKEFYFPVSDYESLTYKSFNIVTPADVAFGAATLGQIKFTDVPERRLEIEDGFIKYQNGSDVTVTGEWWIRWGAIAQTTAAVLREDFGVFAPGDVVSIFGDPVRADNIEFQPWDVNADGQTTIVDLILVITNHNRTLLLTPRADVNGDGTVNKQDILLVAEHLGDPTAAAAPANWTLPDGLTPTTLQEALNTLRAHDDGSFAFQRSIAYLEHLLAAVTPEKTVLLSNYPNPFNPETWIPYHLSKPADVAVTIYAIDGTLVRTLSLGQQPAGVYQRRSRAAYWDGKNAAGEPVASGLYFYTLKAGDFAATRKMLIRK